MARSNQAVKVQLAEDIRLVFLLQDASKGYDRLLVETRNVFSEKLNAQQPLSFKYKDAAGDCITVFDSKSLMFACNNVADLKLVVSVSASSQRLPFNPEQVGLVREQLCALKTHVCSEIDRLVGQLDEAVASPNGGEMVRKPGPLDAAREFGSKPSAGTKPQPQKAAPEEHQDFEWHKKASINDDVKKFHNQKCKQPDMKKAKEAHTKYMRDVIETGLRQIGLCTRLEFTGSSYEGVKVVDQQKLEFDVMIMMKGKDIETSPVQPGYVLVSPKPGKEEDLQFKDILDVRGHISAEKLANVFFGHMQKLVNCNTELKKKAKLRKHGPAVQMDVHDDDGQVWFYVDLVPAYDIPGATGMERYVAKPLKDHPDNPSLCSAWRRSFSGEEKERLKKMDNDDGGCRKQCLRILKVMRNKEACFQILTTYHLKTVLFYECDQKTDGELWQSDHLGERVLDLLGRLGRALKANRLKHYFIPEINLLKDIPEMSRKNMNDRIRKLRTKEEQFKKFIAV